MSKPLSVVVAGGGIGGLAAALVLGRQGHEVTVLEQSAAYMRRFEPDYQLPQIKRQGGSSCAIATATIDRMWSASTVLEL